MLIHLEKCLVFAIHFHLDQILPFRHLVLYLIKKKRKLSVSTHKLNFLYRGKIYSQSNSNSTTELSPERRLSVYYLTIGYSNKDCLINILHVLNHKVLKPKFAMNNSTVEEKS